MSTPQIGSYVTHAKMPELGAGEILTSDKGAVRIRFASGERNFIWDMVASHLTVTTEAPAPPPKASKRARKAPAKARVAVTSDRPPTGTES
jgi:hypothetical protein